MGFDALQKGHGDLLPVEQLALLKRRNFGLHPLSTASNLDRWKLLGLTWQPVSIFVLSVCLLTADGFRFSSEGVVRVLHAVGVLALALFPAFGLTLLLVGVVSALAGTRVRPSAVMYWTWWPWWKLVLCVSAAWAGNSIGNALWHNQFLPHLRLQRMQAYSDVDPRTASGKRLQDAGAVAFSPSAGVDRMRSGCIKNRARYCVAPILPGGELKGSNSSTTQDLFMVGVDCCDCPGEFRCGSWALPSPPGGLRIVDPEAHDRYMAVAEEWAATHSQVVGRPIFFEWVSDPMAALDTLRARGVQLKALALLVGPLLIVLAALALNGLLIMLHRLGAVALVQAPPLPPPGLGQAMSLRFLPGLHEHHAQQRMEQEAFYEAAPKYVIL
mmetsp:Transcript_107145/g.308285  ORF Transcript_107145/g.308285 Transcript_107145/m.308285 type:complete len:384 (-) Transcript_107145:259-1410(-)|eukprot:CAMPEP_0170257024 /NCGR_PEP_ID=MMETSP0116_2-20130129/28367_1 /TAXON_ID=400756 /ORGANISM="Durinskia baltica, Strain CSIRO CS-38" /LENGTH=383 /DNA_ID=CAMNT_0010508037 /DNA_START=101 /DNA_END=1252 /DNA_ORIENTATION=+